MLFAALETSTEWCSVALCRGREIAALERHADQRHGELALPMLERLLAAWGAKPGALEGVAFGAGPGSFTGLRIACAVAQGLAFARNLPVLGVSSLEALAEESGGMRVVACLDARMREVYYAALEKQPDGTGWSERIAPLCAPPGEVPRPAGRGWLGCGSGFGAYGAQLRAALGEALAAVQPQARPSAVAVARLAAPRLEAGAGVDAARVAPLYVRDKVALTIDEQRVTR
jgi:tRNA threonylcarbamoyladenosine biosynthesis protein TsaB